MCIIIPFDIIEKMGVFGKTKKEKINKHVQDAAIAAIVKVSDSSKEVVSDDTDYSLVEDDNRSNMEKLKMAEVSMRRIQELQINRDITTNIISYIIVKLESHRDEYPEISASKTNEEVRLLVERNVESHFSSAALSRLAVEAEHDNGKVASADGEKLTVAQVAKAIDVQVKSLGTTLSDDLISGTTANNGVESFVDVGAVMNGLDALTLGYLSDLSESLGIRVEIVVFVIFIVIFLLVIILFCRLRKSKKEKPKTTGSGLIAGLKAGTLAAKQGYKWAEKNRETLQQGVEYAQQGVSAFGRGDNIMTPPEYQSNPF